MQETTTLETPTPIVPGPLLVSAAARSMVRVLWFDLGWIYGHLRELRAAIDRHDIGSVWTHYGATRSVLLFHIHWEDDQFRRMARCESLLEVHRMVHDLREWHERLVDALDEIEWVLYQVEDDVTLDSIPVNPCVDHLETILAAYCDHVEGEPYARLDRALRDNADATATRDALARWREQSSHVYLQPHAARSHPAHGSAPAEAVGW
jgi:hypothetical protein